MTACMGSRQKLEFKLIGLGLIASWTTYVYTMHDWSAWGPVKAATTGPRTSYGGDHSVTYVSTDSNADVSIICIHRPCPLAYGVPSMLKQVLEPLLG